MDTILVFIAGFFVFLSAIMILGIFVLKGSNAHAGKIAHEQELLNRKNGVEARVPSTNTGKGKKPEGFEQYWRTILFVIVGAVALYLVVSLPSLQSPSTGTVWATTKNYWLLILAFIGLVSFYFYVFPKEKEKMEKAGKVLKTLAVLVLVLFVGMPLVHLAWGEKTPVPHQVTEAKMPETKLPNASSPQSPLKLEILARDRSELILPIAGQHPEVSGFGKFLVHNMRSDGTECAFGEMNCTSGPLLKGYYVSNESDVTISVTVTFKSD